MRLIDAYQPTGDRGMAEHFLCRGDLDAKLPPTGSEGSAKVVNNPITESYLLPELASVAAPSAKRVYRCERQNKDRGN
jgi:hypothetical protein